MTGSIEVGTFYCVKQRESIIDKVDIIETRMSSLNRIGVKWTKEETILAFDLYCKTSFRKISSLNQEIIELADLLGRTPSSVALKMQNLAHFDPELRKRNIIAMSHGSKQDAAVWQEFSNDWEELSYQARLVLAKLKNERIDQVLMEPEIGLLPEGEVKEQLVKSRIGQYFFRMAVLNSYENRCCITGLAVPELLVASHIKPWKNADSKTERTNPMNGLSLNALHDKAFDRGLITVTPDYIIKVSSKIKPSSGDIVEDWLLSFANKKIRTPNKFLPKKEFLEFHNDVIFLR